MGNLFIYKIDCGYDSTETFDELIEDIECDFDENVVEEIKEWALNSKKGDGYKKYGVHILNIGREC